MNFPALQELEAKIATKTAALAAVFAEAGDTIDFAQIKSLPGSTADKVAWVQAENAELATLNVQAAEKKALRTIAESLPQQSAAGDGPEQGAPARSAKSFGEKFAKSDARTRMGSAEAIDHDVKTLMSRSAGWNPESLREPGYVPAASAPIMILDMIPTLPTKQAAIKYMEQTTRTSNAAERAEGGTYGEAAFVLTERSVTVETVGVWIPVTDEQLEDEAEAAAMIDLELPMMLRQRMDLQALVGDGTTPNILGVNNKASIQTQAKGADPVFDAVHKGLTKVRVTGRAMPDLIVMHPNDWEGVRLTRTADGLYILGNPYDQIRPQLWGLPVAISDNQTENTAILGDFGGYARLYIRRDIVVERTNSHDTYFINGKQAIRAGVRCATVWKRAAAFCTVTGI